jgi:hypothetical protein
VKVVSILLSACLFCSHASAHKAKIQRSTHVVLTTLALALSVTFVERGAGSCPLLCIDIEEEEDSAVIAAECNAALADCGCSADYDIDCSNVGHGCGTRLNGFCEKMLSAAEPCGECPMKMPRLQGRISRSFLLHDRRLRRLRNNFCAMYNCSDEL